MAAGKRGASRFLVSKRGDVTEALLFRILEALIAMLAVVAMFAFIDAYAANTVLEKMYFARDLAYLTDIVQASPYGIEVTYYNPSFAEVPLSTFEVTFVRNEVDIRGGEEEMEIYYPLAYSELFTTPLSAHLQNPGAITFSKTDTGLLITNPWEQGLDPRLLTCPPHEQDTELSTIDIVLDPAHGGADHGAENRAALLQQPPIELFESRQAFLIANGALSRLRPDVSSVSLTRGEDASPTLEERQAVVSPETDVFISIGTGSDPELLIGELRAYIPPEYALRDNNTRLACLLTNAILEAVPSLSRAAVIVSDDPLLDLPHPEGSDPKTLAVMLEIGNIQIPPAENPLSTDWDTIAGAVDAGFRRYYR
ncbi:N-acetylmuramoyl-L-alanine amidase [Candidatus Woesearchaeota archaeon]|nr:N-acetylmuramoyl-L-alanine amidase [Candidatus Woesearchaeota archaeon]